MTASSKTIADPARSPVLGVGISAINLASATDLVFQALEERRKGYVCVTGVHGVIEAQDSAEFRNLLNNSFLTTPDGMPMVWLGKWNGFAHMGRVYGPDLMLEVCERSAHTGHSHYFYGGAEGVAADLRARLEERFPGLRVLGASTPPFRPLTTEERNGLREEIARLRPDCFWVGLSTPKQEKFIAEFLPELDTTLMFGVGAAFDFHSGRVRQAPRWIQRSGFEWLFRVFTDPKRLWKRYFVNNTRFVWCIGRQLILDGGKTRARNRRISNGAKPPASDG
ncbi:MAG TPA: WecB/TagA/CpsF family glycosyltransferase [Verrucomicrobiales bacterium]|nr:WecB/TagA/CpsF family glycosyltransferase [Verrucomicrobiales bacterium]